MAIENNPQDSLKNISDGLRSIDSKILNIQDTVYKGLLSVSDGNIKPELFIIGLVVMLKKIQEVEEDVDSLTNDVDNILNREES